METKDLIIAIENSPKDVNIATIHWYKSTNYRLSLHGFYDAINFDTYPFLAIINENKTKPDKDDLLKSLILEHENDILVKILDYKMAIVIFYQ